MTCVEGLPLRCVLQALDKQWGKVTRAFGCGPFQLLGPRTLKAITTVLIHSSQPCLLALLLWKLALSGCHAHPCPLTQGKMGVPRF